MINFVQGGFSPVPYLGFKALRGSSNSAFTAWEDIAPDGSVNSVLLTCDAHGVKLACVLDSSSSEYADYTATTTAYANMPISIQEVRFKTHDFSDKSDWDGRTHGDQVAYLAGGVIKHPVDGSWLDSTGASMIASYANPSDAHYQDPTYLFGAWGYRITGKYDDVNYQWLGASSVRLCYLDVTSSPSVWKDNSGSTVVHYNGTDWIRDDNSSVVTSSLWRVLPYELSKIQINKALLQVDTTATFTGSIHYLVYMNLAAGIAGAGYPAGNYKVRDWDYASLTDFQQGTDTNPYVEPMTRTGHSGPIMTMSYDYQNATQPQVIDSALGMHLDILIDSNTPVTNTLGAHATFICVSYPSF